MGIFFIVRIFIIADNPSIFGIIISMRISCISSRISASTASSPLYALRIEYPSRSRSAEIAFTMSWSSSTTSITEFSILFIFTTCFVYLIFIIYILFYLAFLVYVNIINPISYKKPVAILMIFLIKFRYTQKSPIKQLVSTD